MRNWFGLFRRKFVRFFKLPRCTQWALVEAILWLGVARGAVLLFPFRLIAPYLGRQSQETPWVSPPAEQIVAEEVALVIKMSSPFTPWRSNCLAQAIAGKMMLWRRGIPSTLYLGLKKDANQLEAHAWLRVGEQIVTGGAVKPQFKTISFFGASSI